MSEHPTGYIDLYFWNLIRFAGREKTTNHNIQIKSPAHKGNVFTHVCHSVHGDGEI